MFDLIIRGGLIADGTGKDAYKADIAVKGDKIVKIGDLSGEPAEREINACGRYVTPGFIDPHSHADMNLLFDPSMEAYLMQGVTTVVGGNCGHAIAPMGDEVWRSPLVDSKAQLEISPAYFGGFTMLFPKDKSIEPMKRIYGIDLDWHSFADYNEKCNKLPLGANVAPLIGYSAVRATVMGMDSLRDPTPEEVDKMAELTEECMKQGAFGISTGRDKSYVPSSYATDDEIIRMLKIVKSYDGVFASHTYNSPVKGENLGRMDGYKEMVAQAKAADIRANISHVHVMGMGKTAEEGLQAAKDTIAYIEQQVAEGVDLSYDIIPSPHCTDFTVPHFAFWIKGLVLMSGGVEHLAENFKVPDFRKLVHTMASKGGILERLDPNGTFFGKVVVQSHKNKEYVGKFMAQIAEEKGVNPLDLMMDMFIEDPLMGANTSMGAFEEANDILCRHPLAMPCADGFSGGLDYDFGINEEISLKLNSMTISFMPRFILRHAKPRFEDTIRQISGFVAERFKIPGRGVIAEGNFADLVVLNRETLHSYDMDENPLQYPEGFEHVIVNGVPTIENKKRIGAAGRVLSKI